MDPNPTRDLHHMQQALTLARESIGLASPNPQVGCVLVDPNTDQVLGEGAHQYDTFDHAEIVALKQAAALGHSVQGATAYVTLEPCSHHGRTAPCADALIAARIARCVVATSDPNPLVSGQGIARLRAADIPVDLGLCQAEARELNLAFAHFIQHRRPFVTLKAALSVDGYLAPPPHTRSAAEPHWLTGPEARAEVHRLRHASDAILTGIGTVLTDNPALTDRSGLPRRRPLLRVLLDPQLRLPHTAQILQKDFFVPPKPALKVAVSLLILCSEDAPRDREETLDLIAGPALEVVRLPCGLSGRLHLPSLLNLLADRKCLSLLVEAGATLNSSFLHEDLVDRAILFFSQTALGVGSVPFSAAGPSPYLLEQRLQQVTTLNFGKDIKVSGLLHDPWPPTPALLSIP